MKNKTRNIFFFFGLAAIIIMILTFDVSFTEMWQHVCHAGWWLVPILGMWVVLYLMNTLTWKIIINGTDSVSEQEPCNVSFLRLFKITISAFALNYATPIGLLGGEPYKIMELSPSLGRDRATSSVLLFAMMHIFAHFWYWVTGILLCIIFIPMDTTLIVALPLMAVFSLGGIYLFTRGYKSGLVVKLLRLIASIPGLRRWGNTFIVKHQTELDKIDSQIAYLHSQNRRSFYQSFFLEYLGRLCHSFEIYFMLRLVGIDGTFWEVFMFAILILAFTSLFANLMFFIPLQLGGREGGFAMSCMQILGGTVGISGAVTIAVFISIICRVREIFWTAIGLILIKIK